MDKKAYSGPTLSGPAMGVLLAVVLLLVAVFVPGIGLGERIILIGLGLFVLWSSLRGSES